MHLLKDRDAVPTLHSSKKFKGVVMRKINRTALALLVASLSGCAGVTFYSDANLTQKTGIPIYAPKPYLLVARTGAKDKPVDISIIYLNDPQKIIYADPRSGFGSSNLTLSLTDGKLTAFGQQTDTKIPELITSLSGLITARATASKLEAEAGQVGKGNEQGTAPTTETGEKLLKIVDDMEKKLKGNALKGLTDTELRTIGSAATALKLTGAALKDPSNINSAKENFDKIKAQADILAKLPDPSLGTPRDNSLQIAHTWSNELTKIVADSAASAPVADAPPTFELYEIIQGAEGPSLRRVNP